MRQVSLVLFCFALLSLLVGAYSLFQQGDDLVVTATALNIRPNPSTSGNPLTTVYRGHKLTYQGESIWSGNINWIRVSGSGFSGLAYAARVQGTLTYIVKDTSTPAPAPAPAPGTNIAYVGSIFNGFLNFAYLRNVVTNQVFALIPYGARIEVVSNLGNGFHRIRYNSMEGLIASSWVSTAPSAVSECQCVIWAQRVWNEVRECKDRNSWIFSAHQYSHCNWYEVKHPELPQKGDIVVHLPCYYTGVGWSPQQHGHISRFERFTADGRVEITGSNQLLHLTPAQRALQEKIDHSCSNVSVVQWPRFDSCTKYYRPWRNQ